MTRPVSLQGRALYRIFALFCGVFVIIAALSFVAFDKFMDNKLTANLAMKQQMVEKALNTYLNRSEYELAFISQDLLLGNYKPNKALDVLFSHHDMLFFGGIDFFYIDWQHRPSAVDPRARLYTKDSIQGLLAHTKINRWTTVTSKDGASLLVYKKNLASKDNKSLGYLYGFISLNDNLTLASQLLDSAGVDMIEIENVKTGHVLLKESVNGMEPSSKVVKASVDLSTSIENSKLKLDVINRASLSDSLFYQWVMFVVYVLITLSLLYVTVLVVIKRLVFKPLSLAVGDTQTTSLPYVELEPLQEQSSQYHQFLQAKDRRFNLLLESTYNAVIFCNEVAAVETINQEAKRLFPGYEQARSVFDFTPISCHQAIQDVLKGEVGVTFELTFQQLNVIYLWRVYSFINENGFRSILFIGRDATHEKRLSWQLEQLKPSSLQLHRNIDVDVLLDELMLISRWPQTVSNAYFRGWFSALLTLIEDLKSDSVVHSTTSVGELLVTEYEWLTSYLDMPTHTINIECSVFVGSTVIEADSNVRNLLRVLFMLMASSGDPSQRHLSVRFEDDLELTFSSDLEIRPLWHWIMNALLQPLHGRQRKLRMNIYKMDLPLTKISVEQAALPDTFAVAWILNDYPESSDIKEAVERLGGHVVVYPSTDAFFMESSTVNQFDVVIIGSDKDIEAQRNMTKALKSQQGRDELPIIWLGTKPHAFRETHVTTLFGYVCDYQLHQALVKACSLEGIIPTYLGDQQQAWVVVGGSRVAKAIWYTELERLSISSQWLATLSEYCAIFPYHPDAIVVLLEPQPSEQLEAIHTSFPNVRFYTVQSWSGMPDNVHLFEMSLPYTGEQISALKYHVQS